MFIIETFILLVIASIALVCFGGLFMLPYQLVHENGHRGWSLVLRGTLVLTSWVAYLAAWFVIPIAWVRVSSVVGEWGASALWLTSIAVANAVALGVINRNSL